MGTYSKLRSKKDITPVPNESPTNVRPERAELPELSKQADQQQSKGRMLKRKSYDLYQDQIHTLGTETRMFFLLKGQQKSMSEMVREAIDEYIQKYR